MKCSKLSLCILFLFVAGSLLSQEQTVVFTSGKEGYKIFRIPAVIRYKKEILAFAEGRVNGGADFGHIDIVMKKSADEGKTWSVLSVVASNDSLQAGNPAPVVDLSDPQYPAGRIFLFYNTGNQSESNNRKGKGIREVWYRTSVDAGATWSEPVNITSSVHRPNQPRFNTAYQFSEDWRSYANTPGHAIQFTAGKYKGRLYVAANHSAGEPQKDFSDYSAHGFYTDDHGKSFHLSKPVAIPGSNEAMAVELPGGQLMMNIRNQKGDFKQRIIAISKDGGVNWDTAYFDAQLPDPVCEGSILSLEQKRSKSILAFCNNADTVRRNNLTLRISYDNGKTWVKEQLIDNAPANTKGDFTAYSDLVKCSDNTIGILYEKSNYTQIVFSVWKGK